MMRHSLIRRAARLLLATLLFQAFLVAGSLAAFERPQDGARVSVCSASGLRWITPADHSAPQPASAPHHCALCGCLAADLPPPLAFLPAPAVLGLASQARDRPDFPQQEPERRPQSRAPPSIA